MKRSYLVVVMILLSLLASGVVLAAEDVDNEGSPYYGAIAGQVQANSTTDAVYGMAGALVAAWRIEGPVITPMGSGAANEAEQVAVFPPLSAGQFTRWATADRSGYYRLADLPPGTYFLAAVAQEAASAWFKPTLGGMVQVTAGKVTQKDLALDGPYGAFGGRVTNLTGNGVAQATIVALPRPDGGVTTRLDTGVEVTAEAEGEVTIRQNGLSIRLEAAGEGEGQTTLTQEQAGLLTRIASYQARTDANGYYFIPFVKPGNYWILAFKNGAYDLQAARVQAQQLARADFRLPVPVIVVQPQMPGLPPEKPVPPPPAKEQPGPPDKIKIFIRGQLLATDVPPILENGRVLLPLRELAEALGASIIWDGKGQGMVTIKKGEVTVKLQVQSKIAVKNGKSIQIDVPAKVQKGRTMVPARFLSQSLGAQVKWDASANSVWIE